MIFDKRSLILFCSNVTLLHLMLLINNSLYINTLIIGPAFVIAPLYLRSDQFFITSLITGLWFDASMQTPFGLFTFLIILSGLIVLSMRRRFRAEKNLHPSILAHIINFSVGLTIFLISCQNEIENLFRMIPTSIFELFISHIILLFLAPWFFNLQRSFFELLNTKKDPESLPFV